LELELAAKSMELDWELEVGEIVNRYQAMEVWAWEQGRGVS
jgi:hypothetical protein